MSFAAGSPSALTGVTASDRHELGEFLPLVFSKRAGGSSHEGVESDGGEPWKGASLGVSQTGRTGAPGGSTPTPSLQRRGRGDLQGRQGRDQGS